jgi:hypothetical protein
MGNQTQGGDKQGTQQGQNTTSGQSSKDNEIRKRADDQGMGRDSSGKEATGRDEDADSEAGQNRGERAGNADRTDQTRTRNP